MGITYRTYGKGYAFWRDEIFIPYVDEKTKEKRFFKKEIPFEETPSYWEYVPEEYGWAIYYVKRGISRRLARCGMPAYMPDGIITMLEDRVITVNDCRSVEENKRRTRERERIAVTSNWSIEWDNKPVLLLVMQKPKMSYAEILQVIKAEGGYVDSDGIIHKGTAENKVYTLD